MPISSAEHVARIAPWWVLAYVAAWPWPGAAEILLSLGSLLGLGLLLATRFRGGIVVLSHEAWALTTLMFFAYWLPQAFSAVDAGNAGHSALEAAKDLRYLPFLWLVAMAMASWRGRRIVASGLAVILGLWIVDALMQAVTGTSLGGPSHPERLSGVFGADNLKLGIVLASLSPWLLEPLAAHRRGLMLAVAAALMGAVVLLSGARAAWVSFALVLGWLAIATWGWRRALPALASLLLCLTLVGGLVFRETLQPRIERTLAAFSGGAEGIDHALSGRLVLWRNAWNIYIDHPVNGVGVDQFQPAYKAIAQPGDQFVDAGQPGAFHAHHILLEILTETGTLGLLLWLSGVAFALRAWRFADASARARARPAAIALCVAVFPLNTHLAVYSTFWGGAILLLAALYAGSLSREEV